MTLSATKREDSIKYRLDLGKYSDALREGLPRSTAAILGGANYHALRLWIAEGQRDLEAGVESTYCAKLAMATLQAEAECEQKWLRELQTMAETARETDWRSRAWLMERRHQRKWRISKAVESLPLEDEEHKQETASAETVSKMTPKELAECLEAGAALIRNEATAQDDARELDAGSDD